MILIEHGQVMMNRFPVTLLPGDQEPEWRGLDSLRVVHAMNAEGEILEPVFVVATAQGSQSNGGRCYLLFELEIFEHRPPVETLLTQQLRQFQQAAIAGPVVEPDDRDQFILPAEPPPFLQRPAGQRLQLMDEIVRHDWHDTLIAGKLMVLREHFQHDHARPPVVVATRPDHAVWPGMVQSPVYESLCLRLQRTGLEQPGQRQ